ncbi:hypothetical protein ASPZODRAFT_70366 [Penicilliopsis zonata CBS 506.65]|uniref:Inosine triphosphate pyrophosphatase n=1 Tax=Penicilliopsis zonata CBS 506.65 TaxID=1073090 RepID=A0A1L9SD99_9EURO|nr:hypothetical protein ASPZODRAFT_70366 [Penicilliopsis zonata CBS 506.65]OJJ45067.1 hypothetical protein ASPZODRAFT_70366 [Penicilliopsis zonata CBS 506.65]
MALLFVTGNANKIAEVRAILAGAIALETRALDIPEIQGPSEEIALDKARRAADIVNGPVLIEDSSLEMNALNGLPGPYIKPFLETLGNQGLNTLLAGFDDKSATAVCTFAFSEGRGCEPVLFQGRLEGRIVPPRGPPRFGWEPIFEYQGETLAEMEMNKKNGLSHRYRALVKFQQWFQGSQQVRDIEN